MIKLTRRDMAPELRARVEEHRQRLKDLLRNGDTPPQTLLDSYRDPQLKAHLVAETHGKCIYCESKITHVYFGDVEHIKPKSRFPSERLDPENLALACALCNNAKSEFWDDVTPLLNPYIDEPDQELFAFGFWVTHRSGHPRAKLSIEQFGLNRQALLERRKERIELLKPLADQYIVCPAGALKNLLRDELSADKRAVDREYALMVRTFLEAACDLQCCYA